MVNSFDKTPTKPLVMLTVRLPPDIHQDLRRIAFDHRRSIHSLLLEGVAAVVEGEKSR
jgi:predicted transcriptional regulator